MSVYSAWNQLLTLLPRRCQILVIYKGDQSISLSIQRRSPTKYVENLRCKLQQCKAQFTLYFTCQSIKFSQVQHLSQFRRANLIWIGSAFFPACSSAGNNGCGLVLTQISYFTRAVESNVSIKLPKSTTFFSHSMLLQINFG